MLLLSLSNAFDYASLSMMCTCIICKIKIKKKRDTCHKHEPRLMSPYFINLNWQSRLFLFINRHPQQFKCDLYYITARFYV